ncbi:MAG: VCBS repeat-containing protein [Bacteroidia bacterium]|nr:VCBS repeat-containing protein [Bacteroidia bacterium]
MDFRSILIFLLSLLSVACLKQENQQNGKALAAVHCAACHLVPEPGDLTRSIWRDHVLPHMGARLGVYEGARFSRDSMLGVGAERESHESLFPLAPALSQDQWLALKAYFLDNSPDTMSASMLDAVPLDLHALLHPMPLPLPAPATTLLSLSLENEIVIGDANTGNLMFLQPGQATVLRVARVGEGASTFAETNDASLVTVMGSFSPTDLPLGYVLALPHRAELPPITLLDHLRRPVDTDFADLNGDGKVDILVCEFGKWQGGLSLFIQGSSPTEYRKEWLWSEPGATQAEVVDIDEDGDLDILALFAQGREGIWLFRQNETHQFAAEQLLSFPPSWGSTSFQYTDVTGDGQADLLLTHGDNADYPPFVKPYHGIRLYELAAGEWKESWFLPFPGAYKAIPLDIDQDGDLDIAAISFFPDVDRMPIGFVVFVQDSPGKFSPHSVAGQEQGRWIVMETADLDNDGDKDLLLGGLMFDAPGHPDMVQLWKEKNHCLVWIENLSLSTH